jgi:uncharacterized membrane protein YkoI
MKKTLAALVVAAAGAAALSSPAALARSAQDALALIAQQGYVALHDLEKQYGHWSARATGADGQRLTVLVNDADGSLVAIRRSDLGTTYPGAAQVASRLRELGYARVGELEFDDGFWEAEVRRQRHSEKIELVLHPVTLQVLHTTEGGAGSPGAGGTLSAAEITQVLTQAGYSRIHDLEFDDGVWEADAVNAAGQRVDLRVDPGTGAVLREKLDD